MSPGSNRQSSASELRSILLVVSVTGILCRKRLTGAVNPYPPASSSAEQKSPLHLMLVGLPILLIYPGQSGRSEPSNPTLVATLCSNSTTHRSLIRSKRSIQGSADPAVSCSGFATSSPDTGSSRSCRCRSEFRMAAASCVAFVQPRCETTRRDS